LIIAGSDTATPNTSPNSDSLSTSSPLILSSDNGDVGTSQLSIPAEQTTTPGESLEPLSTRLPTPAITSTVESASATSSLILNPSLSASTAFAPIDAIIDNQNYPLPAEGQPDIQLLQPDGLYIVLGWGKVIVSGDTIPIDMTINAPSAVSSSHGLSIQAVPGPYAAPASGAGSGLGGSADLAFQMLKDLSGVSNDVATGLQGITKQVTLWTEGGSDDLLSGMDDLFQNTMDGFDKIIKGFRGSQKLESIELMDLTEQGTQVITDLQTEAIKTLDLLASLNKLRLALPTISPRIRPVIQQEFTNFLQVAALSITALLTYAELNWDQAVKVSVTTTTTMSSTSTTSTSTSSPSSSSTAQATSYCVLSYFDTPDDKFKSWTVSFDGGKGILESYGVFQMYITDLNSTEVDQVKALDFVQFVLNNVQLPLVLSRMGSSNNRTLSSIRSQKRQSDMKRSKVKRTEFPRNQNHLRMISTPKGESLANNYFADESLGRGVRIFVIDTGFNNGIPVSLLVSNGYYARLIAPGPSTRKPKS
jgi:hypothetical protein